MILKRNKGLKCLLKDLKNRGRNFIFFSKMKNIKLNVGSGFLHYDGTWYNTDIDSLDITRSGAWKRLLGIFRVDNIMAEHVWEHLTDEDTILANKNCYKYLKRNGVLRIAVPDGFHSEKKYIEHVKPGGTGAGATNHKVLYNYITLKERLEKAGFLVNLLEYWDERGNFHFTEWTDEAGHITRSRRYDERNQDGSLNYTSLIVDAIKH